MRFFQRFLRVLIRLKKEFKTLSKGIYEGNEGKRWKMRIFMKKKGMKMVLLMDGRRGKMKEKRGFLSILSPCK